MGNRPLALFLPLFLFAWLLAAPESARAAWGAKIDLPPPAPVVDEFGLLSSDEAGRLTQLVRSIKAKSGVEVAVFIPANLRGLEIAEFGIDVAEQWKLGKKKVDKGLILLVAPKERKMRIEVGYGLEGEITDAFSRRVLDKVMAPYFRTGRYYEGIVRALYAIQEKVPLGLDAQEAGAGEERGAGGGSLWRFLFSLPFWAWILIFYVVVYIPFVIFVRILQALGIVQRPRHRFGGGWGGGGWGGGGFGGGSWGGGGSNDRWGGGGGGFGGGGASSSW